MKLLNNIHDAWFERKYSKQSSISWLDSPSSQSITHYALATYPENSFAFSQFLISSPRLKGIKSEWQLYWWESDNEKEEEYKIVYVNILIHSETDRPPAPTPPPTPRTEKLELHVFSTTQWPTIMPIRNLISYARAVQFSIDCSGSARSTIAEITNQNYN